MENSQMTFIRNKINAMPQGSAFVVSDFTEEVEYENAKKCLLRLEQEGFIRRVIRGIYDKPYFSKVLNEYSAPNIEEVAKAIARNYNWQIAPSGLTALNLLGLSNQVTNSYEYYSSGQYKTYGIGNIVISFKHKSSKELLNMSYKTSLVIQAIKELGPNIDTQSLSKIKKSLSQKEMRNLLNETNNSIKWIYEIIKTMCYEGA